MSYQALYRKFRPQTFDEVKGQDAIVTTLKNQIKNDRIAHAYLFCGTRGTGKTSIAKLFARAVNCENPNDGSPCGDCASCRAIAQGASLNVVEMDAASNNGVEDVRQIVEEVSYSPTQGRFRVYIIDEVHMLSTAAFNALLKTLEEPPSYVIFVLATTEVHKIPITILSRCQRYDFRRIDIQTIAGRMRELVDAEQVKVEDRALTYIAKCADGSMRDALSLLDQCMAFYLGEELTYEKSLAVLGMVDMSVFSDMLRLILKRDVTGAIHLLEEVVMKGRELSQFVTDFVGYLRNLLLIKASGDDESVGTALDDVINVSAEHRKLLMQEAELIDNDALMRYIRIFSDLSGDIRYSSQKRVLIEMAIIKVCSPQSDTDISGLIMRIRAVEEKLEKGVVVSPARSAGPGGDTIKADSAPIEKQAPLPKALPADVKQTVASWDEIVGELDTYIKPLARQARLSVENDVLLLVFDSEGGYETFKRKEIAGILSEAIKKHIQKEVRFDVRLVKAGDIKDDGYPDLTELKKRGINFDNIEIE